MFRIKFKKNEKIKQIKLIKNLIGFLNYFSSKREFLLEKESIAWNEFKFYRSISCFCQGVNLKMYNNYTR